MEWLAACCFEFFGGLAVRGELDVTGCGDLLLECSAVLERDVGIFAVGWVFQRFREGCEGKASATEEVDEIGQHLCVEGADVEEKDVGDVVTVEGVGYFAEDGDVLVGGGEVAQAEKVDRLVIMFVDAAGVWLVPEVVVEVERDLGDPIAVLLEPDADCVTLFEGFAFLEVGISEPVPVLTGHQSGQERLILCDVGFVFGGRKVVEPGVGVGVADEWFAGGAPDLEDCDVFRLALKLDCVDEAVDQRHVLAA